MASTDIKIKLKWQSELNKYFYLNEKNLSNSSMFYQAKLKLDHRGSGNYYRYINLIFHCLYFGLY